MCPYPATVLADRLPGILPEDTLDQLTALAKNEAMYSQVLTAGLIEGWLLFLDDAPHAMAFWGPSRDEETQGWAELDLHP